MTTQLELDKPIDDGPRDADVVAPIGVAARALTFAPVCLVVLLMAILLRYSAMHLNNFDTWFHLTLGDRFRTGEWSLSAPGALTRFASSDWVATQWSTEVLASLFEQWFGLAGVAWLFGTFYAVWVLATYAMSRWFGRPLPSAIVTGMVVVGSAPAISARPQIISLLLLSVTVYAWLRTVQDGRVRWWLVPLTWVWATAHGLWSAGILVGVVCCVGMLLDRQVSVRRFLVMLGVPVASFLVTAVTPVGPRLLTSQFAVSARSSLITEWGPTSFRTVPALVVAAMIAWVVVLWARRGSVRWTPLLLLLLAAGWTLLVARMVALGAVVTAPLLVQALEARMPARAVRRSDRRIECGTLALGALGFMLVLGLAVPRQAEIATNVPSQLLPRLEALPSGSSVVVDDGVGSWIEWAVPDVAPVIDGMLDAYPVGYIRDFTEFKSLQPGWQDFLERSHARVAVLQADKPLTAALQDQLHWRVVQQDDDWVYLVAPDPAS